MYRLTDGRTNSNVFFYRFKIIHQMLCIPCIWQEVSVNVISKIGNDALKSTQDHLELGSNCLKKNVLLGNSMGMILSLVLYVILKQCKINLFVFSEFVICFESTP